MIAVGLAMIMSFVWGADAGGLFTALGVTSMVLGLALQKSVGQIVSGLLLLFEQPFQLGDWRDTPSARGRVVEVNWRATHVDTGGDGLQIMANSVLAAAPFNNLSRVAATLPQRRLDAAPKAVTMGGLEYRTSIPSARPPTTSRRPRSCGGSGTRHGEPSCTSTKPGMTSPHPNVSPMPCT